jgi:biopolymer transport protein ExbD
MSMNIGASNDGPLIEINTTPLIDVLLVLLIMLIITLPAMTHAIKLDVPIGVEGAPEPPPAIEVGVDFDNVVVWNGSAVGSLSDLEMMMQQAARTTPQPHLNVRADRRSHYDTVAHVLAIAQRNGMRHIGIQGTP